MGWRNGRWFEKTSSGHDGMTIVFNGSQRSIVNKPLSRSSLHQYLCVHHPHPGGHERVRQEMDGCVAATQEYPGTTPPKNVQALSLQKYPGTNHPKDFPTLGGSVNLVAGYQHFKWQIYRTDHSVRERCSDCTSKGDGDVYEIDDEVLIVDT